MQIRTVSSGTALLELFAIVLSIFIHPEIRLIFTTDSHLSFRNYFIIEATSSNCSFVRTVKPVLSGHLKIYNTKVLKTKSYLNEGRKYCRMLPLEHYAILLTCIKQLPLEHSAILLTCIKPYTVLKTNF